MTTAIAAELYGARHRRGFLACSTIWVVQIVLFAYAVNFIVSQTVAGLPRDQADAMVASVLPQAVGSQIVGSLPMYGAPVMIIIGALMAAGDEKSGVLRTILVKFPERGKLIVARVVVLAIIVTATILVSLVAAFVCSLIVAGVSGGEILLPSLGIIARDISFSVLIGFAWAVFGFTLGLLARSLAVAIGIGLLWALVAEQALHGLASVVPHLDPLRSVLISGASAVLASESGVSSMPGGVPSAMPLPLAIVVLAAWIVIGTTISYLNFNRRDV